MVFCQPRHSVLQRVRRAWLFSSFSSFNCSFPLSKALLKAFDDSDKAPVCVPNSRRTRSPLRRAQKKSQGWSPALLYSFVLDVSITLHWSLPSCLRCSDNNIVSLISFRRLKSLHPG